MINKYFKRVTVSGAAFPAISAPDVSVGFPGSISLINEGTGIVEYSFDGTNVQGDMVPGTGSQEIVFEDTALNVIWFRLKSGATSAIRVEASEGGLEVGNNTNSSGGVPVLPANAAQETGGNLELLGLATAPSAVASFGNTERVIGIGAYDSGSDSMRNLYITPGGTSLLVDLVTVGQKTMAASAPVVIASNQSSLPITVASLPLPSGASTSALQTTGNTSLSSIDGKITAVNTGAVVVSSALPTGANLIGRVDMTPTGALWSDFATTAVTSGQIVAAASGLRLRSLRIFNPNAGTVNIAIFNGAGTWGTATNLLDFFVLGTNNATIRDYSPSGVGFASGIFCVTSTGVWTIAAVVPAVNLIFNGLSGS